MGWNKSLIRVIGAWCNTYNYLLKGGWYLSNICDIQVIPVFHSSVPFHHSIPLILDSLCFLGISTTI